MDLKVQYGMHGGSSVIGRRVSNADREVTGRRQNGDRLIKHT